MKFYQVINLFKNSLIAVNYRDDSEINKIVVKSALHWKQCYLKDKKNPLFLRNVDYVEYNQIYEYFEVRFKK
jgi:CTP:phosphocholine cytidylyltransferase-like protein